ncbi:hypothetical protein OQA88_10205 [Cercophora sp. LCS_1]
MASRLVEVLHLDRDWGSDWGSVATASLAILTTIYLIFYRLQTSKKHPDEPPVIASAIPYVGHLLGMALFGGRYVKGIGIRNRQTPIFTLPVPFSRIYVVTDPSLAAAVQRASKTLSFTPLVPDITKRVLGFDAHHHAIIAQNIDPEPSDPRGLLSDIHDLVWTYLGPGDSLTKLSLTASREFASRINTYALQHTYTPPEEVSLLIWLRHFVALTTATFLYGPNNPIAKDPSLEQSFWDFDHGLGSLLIGILPSLTARKPYQGRERLAAAFTTYLTNNHHNDPGANDIIRRRIEIATAHGFTLSAAARSEVSFLFAGIVNTATTTFWVLLHLYARPDLLNYIRAELLAGAVTELDMGGDKPTRLLDQEALKTNCPTLTSVFREALRTGSDFYSTRLVKSDTTLAGKWWVGKGSVVQIAGGVIHADPNIWGESAEGFDPQRFIKLEKKGDTDGNSGEKEKGVHPAAFRAFGGGKTLCPGRHFATHEILAFVAMVVLTLDIEAADGGPIKVPGKEDGVMPVHILEPKGDVRVKVSVRRDGGEVVVVR